MTDLQALVLFTAVQRAKKSGGVVPSAADLVKLLPKKHQMGTRSAAQHLLRLHETFGCFEKHGKKWVINPEALVTEIESARVLILVSEICSNNADGRADEQQLTKTLTEKLRFPEGLIAEVLGKAKSSGYLATTAYGYIRASERALSQLKYMRLLVQDGFADRGKPPKARER
jgi:hypothetical protein